MRSSACHSCLGLQGRLSEHSCTGMRLHTPCYPETYRNERPVQQVDDNPLRLEEGLHHRLTNNFPKHMREHAISPSLENRTGTQTRANQCQGGPKLVPLDPETWQKRKSQFFPFRHALIPRSFVQPADLAQSVSYVPPNKRDQSQLLCHRTGEVGVIGARDVLVIF